ncbi:MAG: putative N-acetyl-LL-diaminopimelate aminotransferase [Candidatus Heimdallarchaeota archaeon LC_3]|nr:MAG: putative N-acetyl-LL-diaminopimelate aminotransferase [Candidatus Heimdallarchaeota archaeon LC_3]
MNLHVLSIENLRKFCHLKWHDDIPDDGIAMGIADIDFKGPDGLVDFITTHLHEDMSFYGPYEGIPSAIEAGNQFLLSKGIPLSESKNLQIIPGTMMGIYLVLEWISRKLGEILMINPIYPPFINHAKQTCNTIKWLDLQIADEWHLNEEKLKENVNENIKLLVFNNPDNEVGIVFKEDEIRLISDLSEDYAFPCFVDELYEPLTFKKSNHISLASLENMQNRCFTLFGFPKAYGFAGWRSGFMHLAHPEFEAIKYIVEQILVAPSPVTSLVMEFALTSPKVFKWKIAFRDQMEHNTELVTRLLTENNIECVRPEGGFFVFPKIELEDYKFKKDLLINQGVEVVTGSEFGPAGKGFIRINCATSEERMEK